MAWMCKAMPALAIPTGLASSLHAEPVRRMNFNIPAQPLSSAIIVFSRQSGVSVVAPMRLIRGKTAPVVRGEMEPDIALVALLAASDLTVRRRGAGVYVVGARNAASASANVRPNPASSRPRPIYTDKHEEEPASGASEIVVTGSRITTIAYQQATPVTVVGYDVIERDAKPSIGDTIRELPAVGLSASPNNSVGAGGIVAGTAGLDTVNLRQLGFLRTLVLFDGQRVVPSNIAGQVDIGTIPTALVERVDVVTAGASAAWGSDAVAGVVNLVLDKGFTGLRANVDIGDSAAGDHRNHRAQIAFGTGFAGGRGHFIATATLAESPEVVFGGRRVWNNYPALIENPAYTPINAEPRYIHVTHIGLSQAKTGGLVTSGPLRGIQFVGPDATPTPFDFGQVSGPISVGGDAEQTNASLDNLTVGFRSRNLFGYSSFEFTSGFRASLQLNYGHTRTHNSSVPVTRFGNLLIRQDNAYLPQSVREKMEAMSLDTIEFGTTNLNNLPSGDFSIRDLEGATVAIPTAVTTRRLKRGVLSFNGDLGSGWLWQVYYQIGESEIRQDVINNLIPANFNRAIDAVVAPPGNLAGIAPGTLVCRSSLTDPNDGCVPLNIFGTGVASPAAIRYVNVRPGQNYQIQRLTEEMVSGSVQGLLPLGLPAGHIAVAFGGEHRMEKARVTTDPGAQARQYALGNFTPFSGSYTVSEAFLEAEIPLLADRLVRTLSLNAAGRLTDYSTSGRVATWKIGVTSQLTPDIGLRGTVSRDIRAPILNELFSAGVATSGSAVDPNSGTNVPIFTFRAGNPDLKPEIARTYSAGVILTPRILPGFSASADYYKITIKDAIFTLSSQQVLARCMAGEAIFCRQLVFGGPEGAFSQINLFPLNINTDVVEGLDFQADYRRPLMAGSLHLRLIGNYVLRQSQDQNGVKVNYAGGIGPDNPVEGVPRMRANLATTYARGAVSVTAHIRLVGGAKLVNSWTDKDVDRNRVPPIAYLDLRGSVRVHEAAELYGTIDNLLNQAPPLIPGTSDQGQNVYYFTAVRGDIYDIIGRSYRIGLRVRF